MLFFADEGGAYALNIDWQEVLPMWFTCLAATTSADDYAQLVLDGIREFDNYYRERHFETASKLANSSQKDALDALRKSRWPSSGK